MDSARVWGSKDRPLLREAHDGADAPRAEDSLKLGRIVLRPARLVLPLRVHGALQRDTLGIRRVLILI